MAITLGEDSQRFKLTPRTKKYLLYGLPAAIIVLLLLIVRLTFGSPFKNLDNVCVQYPAIVPSNATYYDSARFLEEPYVQHSAKLLGGAVKIPTETYDDMKLDPSKDDRFLVFNDFHKYLAKEFPLAAAHREVVNEYGLLYTFEGTNKKLKPIVLMAHQDVVPVNPSTTDQWTYPPFSGHFDGKYLYGRGSSDTKNSLIGILEAVEALLQQEWIPTRTVILSFGFDEEIEGTRGAKYLAKTIHKRYGTHGVEVIIDEGFGMQELGGGLFALPAASEKGRIDFQIELFTPGGHGSMPPDHTGIGIMAELATILEKNPIAPNIEPKGVVAQMFSCVGRWAPDLGKTARWGLTNINKKANRNGLIKKLVSNKQTRGFVQTSQAIDTINGGVKINALPEKVVMGIDYRVAVHQSLDEVKDRLAKYIKGVAKNFDLAVEFDGKKLAKGSYGSFKVLSHDPISPAPISSTSGKVWTTLSGTAKHVFQDVVPFWDHKTVNVGPSIMTANTDTAHYWEVSKDIYRFNPVYLPDLIDFHTVNERIRFRSHISTVIFFYEWIINWTTEE